MIDSTRPKIIPINLSEGKDMSRKWSIMMKIGDNLSGIKKYRGTVDGKWVLMEYDAKKSRLTYLFDDQLKAGIHTFKLVVSDKRNNTAVYTCKFRR